MRTTAGLTTLILVLAMMMAGCASTGKRPAGLPSPARIVGGGFYFSFKVPADGMIYIVDAGTNRVLGSQHVSEGDDYSAELTNQEELRGLMPGQPEDYTPQPVFYYLSYNEMTL